MNMLKLYTHLQQHATDGLWAKLTCMTVHEFLLYFLTPMQEVELCRIRSEEKLGLTLCYRTDEEEDVAIYVSEVSM